MFETLEVVWPSEVARRVRLVSPLLDRGIALLRRVAEQRDRMVGLEAVLGRIQTAVLTVGPSKMPPTRIGAPISADNAWI